MILFKASADAGVFKYNTPEVNLSQKEISRGIFKRAYHDQMKRNAMRALAMNRALHNFLG